MLGAAVAIKSPAEFYQALHLSPKGDLVVTTRQLLRISNLANLLDKPTLLRAQQLKDPILVGDISKDDSDLWKLTMLPDGPHPTNPFRSSKSRRKDKICHEPARFVQSISTPLVGPRRRCYLLSLQSDGRVLLYMMNGDRSLVDFGALLVENYFKKHAKQDEVDINEYLNTMELLMTTTIACSPVISNNGEDSFLVVLGTRAGDVHIWKVTEQPSEDVPSVTFVAEATHGDWITAADWTLIKQELFLATGAADGSVKLWKTDAKKLSTVTAVKEINESDMYRVQALSWAPKQKGILAIAKSTLLEFFDLNGKLPQDPTVVHAKPITQIDWRSCGEIIFTTGLDSIIKSWTYLPRNNSNTAAQAELMEIETESIRQLSHLNTLDFIPQQWGVMGMALSPNGIVAPILTFKPAETVGSSMYSNKSAAASLSLVETNATSLEDTIDFIINQPPPATYWDLILVLSNKETQICLDLAKHTEERYIDNASNEQTRMRACKLAYVLYRWVKSKLPSSDDQLTHVTARITQLTQQINQHHADREVNSFLAKKRAPSTREASSLTRLRNFLEPAQRANIDKVLQSVKQATALQCPFCQAQVTGDDHCLRNPTHPLQFCALTMILIDTTQTLKCATCHQETLILRDEKENNFDWITEPDLCPTCNSLLANNMAI